MADDAPVFEYKLPGSGVRLYENRIESWKAGMLPWAPKRTVVPLRNISSVEKGLSGKVTVVTNDGKRHEFVAGFQSDKLRDAILQRL